MLQSERQCNNKDLLQWCIMVVALVIYFAVVVLLLLC